MKRTLLLSLLLVIINFGFGQIKQVVYSNAEFASSDYLVVDAVETMDGGYALLAHNDSQNNVDIMRLDANGDIVWQSTFEASSNPTGGAIEEVSNGNFILAYSLGDYTRVIQLDASGGLIWKRSIHANAGIIAADQIGITIDESGPFPEFILYGGLGPSERMYMVRLGNTGGTIWSRRFQDTFGPFMQSMEVHDVIVHSNGSIYGVATSSTFNHVFSTDNLGQGPVFRTLNMKPYAITETTSGDLIIVGGIEDGFGNDDAAYRIFSPSFSEVDFGSFGSSNSETATAVIQNADNSFSLAVADNSTGSSKAAIYKLDGSNDLEWAKAYGGNGTDIPSGIFQKPDGGWTLISTSNSFSPSDDVYVVMTDNQGTTIGCQENLAYVAATTISFATGPMIASSGGFGVTNNSNPAPTEISLHDVLTPYPTSLIVASDPACFGSTGSADLTVSGGVVPYTYSWSSGTFAEDLNNELAGTFTVNIEDANGCIIHDTISLVEPSQMTSSTSQTDLSCAGALDGSIDLTVGGGTPGYSYLWSYNGQTTEDLSSIPGGFYQVTITDANGCENNEFVSVSEPTPLVAGMQSTSNPSCHDFCDGIIDGVASGGTMPYSYLWNDISAQTNAMATGLCSGSYLLTVTDANGCTTIANTSLSNPDELTAVITTTPSECGLMSGTALAGPVGGTMPYSYNWISGSTLDNESGLDVGTYSVEISDANGCILNEGFSIAAFVAPVEICLITVDSTSQFNQVVWAKPVADNIEGFKIYRNVSGSYDEIAFVPYANLSSFDDQTFGVDPNVTSYRYKISVVDTCGNESGLSAYHESIHLTVTEGLGGEVNCIWDNYEGFPFVEYNILKDTTDNGIQDWFVDDQVSNISFTWTDLDPEAFVRYTIEVIPDDTCSATKAQDYNSSRSNRGVTSGGPGSSITENGAVFNLNLFPNPNNGDFNISLTTIQSGTYNFQIMDIQGKLVTAFQEQLNLGAAIIEIDNLELEKGVYLLQLSGEFDNQTLKFTVLR